ncbi:MAG: O-antigen ligase family protein [Hyphomicrobiales bacterium]
MKIISNFCRLDLVLKLISAILIIAFPLDQLYPVICPNMDFLSPLKILSGFFVLFIFRIKSFNASIHYKKEIYLLLSVVLLCFISISWAEPDKFRAFVYSLQMFVLWSFCIVSVKYLKSDFKFVKRLIFGMVVFAAIVAIFILLGFFSPSKLSVSNRIGFGLIGLNSIAISMGYSAMLGILCVSLFSKRRLLQIIFIICICVICYLVLRLGTRSVIWGILVSFVLANIFVLKKKDFKKFILTFLIIIIGCVIIYNLDIVKGYLADRIFDLNAETITNNSRINLWLKGINWYFSNPLGSGAGNEKGIYMLFDTQSKESHNTILSTINQISIVGGILLLAFLFFMIKKGLSIKNRTLKYIFIGFYIFFLIQIFKGSLLQTRLFWHPIMFLLLTLEIDFLIYEKQNSCTSKLDTSEV